MKGNMLSVTDENTILITAEFLEDGMVFKVGERTVHRYEIDLIVKKTITCEQLLTAIGEGLKNKLLQKFGYDVDKSDNYSFYRGGIDPDNKVFHTDEKLSVTDNLLPIVKKSRKKLSVMKKIEQKFRTVHYNWHIKKLQKHEDELRVQVNSNTNLEQPQVFSEKEEYIICWNTFFKCYEKYKEGYPEEDNLEVVQDLDYRDRRKRYPVIGTGSVNYQKIENERKLCESERVQILLYYDKHKDKTLEELGFITTTRLIFDPIKWHQSCALFEVADTQDKDKGQKKAPINLAFSDQLPEYNISDRPLRVLDDTPIHVIPPTEPPKEDKTNLLATLVPAMVTSGSMLVVRSLFMDSSNYSMLAMSAVMPLAGVISHRVSAVFQKKQYKESLEEWKHEYQEYINDLIASIKSKQEIDISHMKILYPPAMTRNNEDRETIISDPGKKEGSLVEKALWIHGDIFSRNPEHPDFLSVRIGLSMKNSQLVPSAFEIQGEKREAIAASVTYENIEGEKGCSFKINVEGTKEEDKSKIHYLIDLPSDLSQQYAYLTGAPVVLKLKECGVLGVIYQKKDKSFLPFLANFLLDLCFHHSPDNLQVVMLCDEIKDWKIQQDIIRHFKHLPHFRELLGSLSPFVFNKNDAYLVFNKLLEILAERKENQESLKVPQIIVIVQNEYDLKRHRISEFLPEYTADGKTQDYGITFVFCTRFHEMLPKFCGQVIEVDEKGKHFLLPHEQILSRESDTDNAIDIKRYRFVPDIDSPNLLPSYENTEMDDKYYRAFKTISALYYLRITQNGNVPENVDLLSLVLGKSDMDNQMSVYKRIKQFVLCKWGKEINRENRKNVRHNIVETLSVPIGRKKEGNDISKPEDVELDLHEKADGPHMLVAGTTGSGKTETILTYLIALCAYYTPEEVNLLLMDMKGAGFVSRIGELPHVVGKVTDVDGDESGTSTAYMLKRFLHSMTAEVKRRKLLLNRMGVDSINAYVEARNDIDQHIRRLIKSGKLDPDKDSEKMSVIRNLEPLPHLFLVIDEFTELMQFTSENGDLDFKGQITSLARIGRSLGFHIILISQNIENAITPDIRVNSKARLCLKVATREASREMIGTDDAASSHMPGNGRAYLLVGTGSRFDYFQSGYSGADISGNIEDPVRVTYAKMSGKFEVFYSEEDKRRKSVELSEAEGENEVVDAREENNEFKEMTQLQAFVNVIKECNAECDFYRPHQVFQQPLPKECYYSFNWITGKGTSAKIINRNNSGRDE